MLILLGPLAPANILAQSHLFLHHILQCHLESKRVHEAVVFASHYEALVYFAHALEILLHTVVESEADSQSEDTETAAGDAERQPLLPTVVEFLDHFDCSLDVIVGCARKTELSRWRRLFDVVGSPKSLFEVCISQPQPCYRTLQHLVSRRVYQ